ncbi:MAG: hypothetical protein A3F10_06845 [Coxiella sp. RIFCSPHIGHO2_12_FULL_42_15]|nr:MAG: hypothetical protein A3F10_06845 [Coxiella sp. RIFCSPHIGHO2_12_FULL_42_15]
MRRMASLDMDQAFLAFNLPVKIRAQDNVIIFYQENPHDEANAVFPVSRSAKNAVIILGGITIVIKGVASLGMRVYAVEDILQNPNYIFSTFFNSWPVVISQVIVILSGASDVFMNVVTRGTSTFKLMRRLFGLSKDRSEIVHFHCWYLTTAKYFVGFCGVSSAVTSSLAAFLGSNKLMTFFTDNFYVLAPVDSVVAIANFVTNISYRISKSMVNFKKLIDKELKYSAWGLLFCVIGCAAFLGSCFYGTSNSLRTFLNLFNLYYGNPDTHENLKSAMENLIYGITDASLLFSIVAFWFSQCAEMLAPLPEIKERHFTIPSDRAVTIYRYLKKNNPYYKNLSYFDHDYWYPEMLLLLGFSIMPIFIFGEMLGNFLASFNGCVGLIVHFFFPNTEKFNSAEKMIIGFLAAVLSTVFSKIYWDFNVVEWLNCMKVFWMSAVLKTMQHADIVRIGDLDPLQEVHEVCNAAIVAHAESRNLHQQGIFATSRSHLELTHHGYGVTDPNRVEEMDLCHLPVGGTPTLAVRCEISRLAQK